MRAKGQPSARLVCLPSGRRVRLRVDLSAPAVLDRPERRKERALWADTRAALRSGALLALDAETNVLLDDAAIGRLGLADFHVLRDYAMRSGLVRSEREDFPCDNCDAPLIFDGARLPVEDLEDRYAGERASESAVIDLSDPIETKTGRFDRVELRAVTLAEATPLHEDLGRDRPFRITPRLVTAMGIARLVGSITLTEPRAIARVLRDASDESWSAVEAGFLSLAYPPRAITAVVCKACGTVHDLEVPWPRELDPTQYHPRRDASAAFPTAEAFEDHVALVAPAIFERMGVLGMTLRVEPGLAEVDEGGIPLLGSYGPEGTDDGGTEFLITLYFRTFERAFKDDPSFDWKAEVTETLEHEAQHHLYFLEGHDPMDAAERSETQAEAVRRAGGAARLRKLQRSAIASDLKEITRVLGPLLLLVAVATALFLRCS